jgi:hypothetical protein
LRSQPLSLRATALKLRTWGIIELAKHRPMLCAATLNACRGYRVLPIRTLEKTLNDARAIDIGNAIETQSGTLSRA